MADEHTEQDILPQIHQGDPSAFNALFQLYGARLCAFAYRIVRSEDVAEELVQDVFLNIWAQRNKRRIDESVATYLYRAVRNRAYNHIRHERIARRHAETGVLSNWHVDAQSPMNHDAGIEQREIVASISRAIEAMPKRTREIFLMNREQGFTYAQIADIMNLSVKAVEYHMGRALAFLRLQLDEWSPFK